MRIGIVGAGHIGGTAAKLFAKAGHQVAVSNSRGPATLVSLVTSIGSNAKATSVVEAIKFGEAVLLALPYRKMDALPPAESFAGTIVIDAMNPYGRREQHTANRLEAVGELLDLLWAPLHDDDLQASLLAEVRMRARPDRAEERMLAMQDAMCDHADVMPIEKGDRAHRASSGLDLPTGKRRSDQVSQGL